VDGKYLFPTYIRSDAYVHTKAGDEQLRLIIKMTGFKVAPPLPAPAGAASPAAPDASSATPAANPSKPTAGGPTKPPRE